MEWKEGKNENNNEMNSRKIEEKTNKRRKENIKDRRRMMSCVCACMRAPQCVSDVPGCMHVNRVACSQCTHWPPGVCARLQNRCGGNVLRNSRGSRNHWKQIDSQQPPP